MFRRRRKHVLIETYERMILHGSLAVSSGCLECLDISEMVSPEIGSRIFGVTQREIFRYIESGAVHFVEDRGSLLVCLRSLTVAVSHKD
ncbi:MAG TPA: hypothetical protein VMZ26_02225 [Pyrinomonadaceae bacterium]|nr:hypothetical protein [Pyrinomonadaceae bacterium]